MKNINEIMDELMAELREICINSLVELCEASRTAEGIAWKCFDFNADDEDMTDEELEEYYKNEESYVSWTEEKSEELYAKIHDNLFTSSTEIECLYFDVEVFTLNLIYKGWEFRIDILNQNAE